MGLSELKEIFLSVLGNYTVPETRMNVLWNEIDRNYSDKNRHYHTLHHLANVLSELLEVKGNIRDWTTLLFALYYHDIIYNPIRSDNEEKSAELAGERMQQIGVTEDRIKGCKDQILATKSHTYTVDGDTNYFTDADLSILGQSWEKYSDYCAKVRREYSIYPDVVYNAGRKKVLLHFLRMERIFKTDHFLKKFGTKAKDNLRKEMQLLK